MKTWLMIQNFAALNTMYRKTPEKQAAYMTPKGVEKQLDYLSVDKTHMCCSRDANDWITRSVTEHKSALTLQHSVVVGLTCGCIQSDLIILVQVLQTTELFLSPWPLLGAMGDR